MLGEPREVVWADVGLLCVGRARGFFLRRAVEQRRCCVACRYADDDERKREARMTNGLRALVLRRGRCWGRVDPGRVDALRAGKEVRGRAEPLFIDEETRGFVEGLRVDDGVRAGRPLRFLLFIGVMVANGVGRGVPVHGLNVGFSNAAHSDFPPLTHVNGVNPIDTNLLLICSSHCWF